MMIAAALVCGFLLDLLLGDPAWMPHPVVIIGKCITRLEKILRRILPATERGELLGGAILVICITGGTLLVTVSVCMLAAMLHPALGFAVQVIWCWQALAVRGLKDESLNVRRCLVPERDALDAKRDLSLENARKAAGRIVGRDTQELTREGVIRATVETVAENFSDGVLAPIFYIAIGGASLGLTYKAINTMDSMVGYKNDAYLYFGRAAARLDDAAGYLPSRIAALFFIAAAAFVKVSGETTGEENTGQGKNAGARVKSAWRMWRRDSRNHASPNSAQTEAACAGALGVRLAGPAYYFGKRYDKPFIGDAVRPITDDDILRTVKMMYAASILSAAFFAVVRLAVCL